MLATQWLNNVREIMTRIEETQTGNIQKAAEAKGKKHDICAVKQFST